MAHSCLNPTNANVIGLVESSRKFFPKFKKEQIRAIASVYNNKFGKLPTEFELLDFYASMQEKTPKEIFDGIDVVEKQDALDLLQGLFFKGLEKVTNGKYLTKTAINENKGKILDAIPRILQAGKLNSILDNYSLYKELLKSNLERLNVSIDEDLEAAQNQSSKDNNWDKDSTFTDNYNRATDETIYLFASLNGEELIRGIPRPLPLHTTWNIVQNLLAGTSDIDTQVNILRKNLDTYPFLNQILTKIGYGDFAELAELDYSSVRTSFTSAFSKNVNTLVMATAGKQSINNINTTTMLAIKEKWASNFRASEYSKVVNNERVFNPDKIDELLNEKDNEKFLNNLGIYLNDYSNLGPTVANIKKYFLRKVKANNKYKWLDDGGFVSSQLKSLQENQLRFIKETKATGARNANGEYQHSVGLHSYTSKILGNLRNKVVYYENEFEKLFYDGIASIGITQGFKGYEKAATFNTLSIGDLYTAVIGDMFSANPIIHLPRTADKKEEKIIELSFDKFKNPTISAKDFYDTKMAYTKISPELYERLYKQYALDYKKKNNPKWGSKTQKAPVTFWNDLLNNDNLARVSKEDFKIGIDNYIENQLPELYSDLLKYKVVSVRDGSLVTDFPTSLVSNENNVIEKAAIENLLRNFIFNSLMFGTEITQLQMGSLTSASPEEFFKRTSGPNATGKIPRTDSAMITRIQAERGKDMKNFPSPAIFRVSISKDDIVPSKNVKDYNREGDTKAYSENNVNDGQGDMLFQSYREWKIMLEEWSPSQEEAWKKMQKGEKLDVNQFGNLFPPIKPVGYSLVTIDGVQVPIYIKTSIYPIYPTLSKGTMNEVAYNSMMENGISINLPMSGLKIAKPKKPKGKFEGGEFVVNKDAIFEFPASGLLSQLDIQVKDSLKQLVATQQQKLIAVNMYNNGGVINKDFENWVEERRETLEKLAEIETKKLEEKAGIEMQDGVPVIKDYTKLAEMLRTELLSRDIPLNTIDAISSIIGPDGRLLNTIDTLPSRQKLMNLLNSIVTNKLIKLYTNGAALVQVAQTGWEMTRLPNGNMASREEILAIDCAIDFINDDAKVNYYNNNGLAFLQLPNKGETKTGAAEILLPAKFKKYVDAEGNIDPRLITNIGYRIPTQGLNSILHLKVVGFLSPGLDQMVVMPREITTQGGSDFDVDKLNIFIPNSIILNNEATYISTEMNPEEIYDQIVKENENKEITDRVWKRRFGEDFNDEDVMVEKITSKDKFILEFKTKQLQNQMIEQSIKVLEHPNSVKSLLTPNSSDELKELSKGLSKKVPLVSMFMPKTLVDITYQMFSAKALVGIFAAQSTQHALAQQVGLHFKSGRPFYFTHNTIMVEGKEQPSLAGVATKTTYKIISDRLGNQYISASVDAAKDPFLFYLGCNLDTGGIFALVERLGGNIEYLVNLIKKPIIQKYLLDMSNNNKLGNKFKRSKTSIIEGILKSQGLTRKDSEFLMEYYPKSEEEREAAIILRYKRDAAYGKPTKSMMLDDFLYLSDAASTVTESIGVIKFDTSGPGKDVVQSVLMDQNYKEFNRKMADNVRYTLATTKNGMQLPYDRIVTDTILDIFYKRSSKFVINLYKDLVALNSNFEFMSILKAFNNPNSPFVKGKLDEESATLLYGTMINYVMQKRLGLSEQLFFGEETTAREILAIQKDESHPLHYNYIMTNVFTPEIAANVNDPDILTMLNKNIDTREQSIILKAFGEIKEYDPILYSNLIKGNFYQTGVVTSPASYYNLLPNTDVMPIANSLLKNHQQITSGKAPAIIDAIMSNIGMKLNNITHVSPVEKEVFLNRMRFEASRTRNKEYVTYTELIPDFIDYYVKPRKGVFKMIGPEEYILLDPQNYKSMFYNMDLSQGLDFSYTENNDDLPFVENPQQQEEDETPTNNVENQIQVSENLPGPETKINIYAGTGDNANLSNFAIRPFTIGGDEYKSVEQYFQYQKWNYLKEDIDKNVFDLNAKVANAIMRTTDGGMLRRFGKKFLALDKETWDNNSSKEMKVALKASFEQNSDALAKLLATGNATLTHTQESSKSKWREEFPRLLMEVREELRGTQPQVPVAKVKPVIEYNAWNEISEESRENLTLNNYTQESFNNLTMSQQNIALSCHG